MNQMIFKQTSLFAKFRIWVGILILPPGVYTKGCTVHIDELIMEERK